MTSHAEHRLTDAEEDTIVCTLAVDCVLDEASAVLLFREITALRDDLDAANRRRETAERLVSVERAGHERVRAALEAFFAVDWFTEDGGRHWCIYVDAGTCNRAACALDDLPPPPEPPLDCQGRPYPDLQASPDRLGPREEDLPCPSCGEGRDKHITICTKYSQMVPVPNVDAAPGGMPVNLTYLSRGIQMATTVAPPAWAVEYVAAHPETREKRCRCKGCQGPPLCGCCNGMLVDVEYDEDYQPSPAESAGHSFIPMSGSQDTSGVYQRCSVIGCTVAPDQHVPMPSQAPDAARSDG